MDHMRDGTRSELDDLKGTEGTRARSKWGENTGDRRRRRTLGLIRDRTGEIVRELDSAVPGLVVVSGAATCAEVRLDERETTHRYLRMSLEVPLESLDLVIAALKRVGWRDSVPGTDGGIIRIAHLHGRRPHFVLLDDANNDLSGPHAPGPTTEAGRSIRRSRFRRALMAPDAVLATSRESTTALGAEIESLEIQILALRHPAFQ
jgi:hypothetical protein